MEGEEITEPMIQTKTGSDSNRNNNNEQYVDIAPSEVEGELKLIRVKLLQRSQTSYYIFVALCVLTVGTLYILCKLWPNLYQSLVFNNPKSVSQATHVHAISVNDEHYYEKLQHVKTTMHTIISFSNRQMKYVFDEKQGTFQAAQLELEGKPVSQIADSQPLQSAQVSELLSLYGKSYIEILIPSYHVFFVKELLRPVNYLLYFGVVVWCLQARYLFMIIGVVSTVVIIILICYFVRRTKQQLKDTVLHDIQLQVIRDSTDQEVEGGNQFVSSQNVVPGDIIEITTPIALPFDCLVLDGQLQVNEANLTGETIPVSKTPLPSTPNLLFKQAVSHGHTLFEGTQIVQLEDKRARLLVVRTGYSSFKGQIIRSLLHPKPFDASIFIAAVKYCILMIFIWAIVYFATLYELIHINLDTKNILYRFCDVIMYCAPPGIPLLINACIFFSLLRLRYKGIFGQDPSKPLLAGKVKTICFDKTGTITENSVKLLGYQLPLEKAPDSYKTEGDKTSMLFKLFGACHSAAVLQGTHEVTGDPIDVEMVKFSGWTLGHDAMKKYNYSKLDNGKSSTRLNAIVINEFNSQYQSMSVICQEQELEGEESQKNKDSSLAENEQGSINEGKKSSTHNSHSHIVSFNDQAGAFMFMKGSPEVVLSKCIFKGTEGDQLKEQMAGLVGQGLRVLGLAAKNISKSNLQQILAQDRKGQEQNMDFIGFLLFKNNLKPDSADVIQQLYDAKINLKIISGDNPVTTLRVAQEAKIIQSHNPKDSVVIDCPDSKDGLITWTEFTPQGKQISQQKLDINSKQAKDQFMLLCSEFLKNICITGNAHSFLSSQGQVGLNMLKMLIIAGQVFARTSPEQKASIVKTIREYGETVCMVGDGTNDSPAIREADVGISFSEADGQFSAPYVSRSNSLDCVIRIVLEGRVAVGVSIEIFVGYIQLCILRLMGYFILSYYYSSYSDTQITWQAYVCGLVLVYFCQGLTQPLQKIQPCQLNQDFFSLYYLLPTVVGFLIQLASQLIGLAILESSSIYINAMPPPPGDTFVFECQPNTVLFLFTLIHYFWIHAGNNQSSPIKKIWLTNPLVTIMMLLQFIHGCIMLISSKLYVGSLKLVKLEDSSLRVGLFFLFNGFGLLQFAFQKIIIHRLLSNSIARKQLKADSDKYLKLVLSNQ